MTALDLAAIEQRANAATEGPWEPQCVQPRMDGAHQWWIKAGRLPRGLNATGTHADVEFVAAARTDVPALVARVRELEAVTAAVRELHWRSVGNQDVCQECSVLADPQVVVWPCPTARALGVTA